MKLYRKTKGLPHHAVEVPGREQILEALGEAGVPLEEADLAKRLAIDPGQEDGFTRRLAAMEREGQVMRNRRGAILIATRRGW